jgi:uncharacterized protein (UPF0212 family)
LKYNLGYNFRQEAGIRKMLNCRVANKENKEHSKNIYKWQVGKSTDGSGRGIF